jgi:hypothetical protein
LIAAGIALAIIATVNGLGTKLNQVHVDQHFAALAIGSHSASRWRVGCVMWWYDARTTGAR